MAVSISWFIAHIVKRSANALLRERLIPVTMVSMLKRLNGGQHGQDEPQRRHLRDDPKRDTAGSHFAPPLYPW